MLIVATSLEHPHYRSRCELLLVAFVCVYYYSIRDERNTEAVGSVMEAMRCITLPANFRPPSCGGLALPRCGEAAVLLVAVPRAAYARGKRMHEIITLHLSMFQQVVSFPASYAT